MIMGFNNNSAPNQQEIIATGADRVTLGKYGVTSSPMLIASPNSTRRSIWIMSLGTTVNRAGDTITWLGTSTNMSSGITGINFGFVNAGNNFVLENYRGPIYAATGTSSATYGVSSVGSSMNIMWLSVADIG